MRVMTYNIHSGVGTDGQHNYRRIGLLLADLCVDIALLQEMDTRPTHRSTEADIRDLCGDHFQWLLPSPTIIENDGWYGNAILTRYPAIFCNTVDVSQVGFQPRNIQEAIIQTGEGPLHVVNTHKGLKRLERRRQIALLDQHLQQTDRTGAVPLLVAGDFNEWQLLTSTFKALNQSLMPHPVGATFPSSWPLFKLDRVWSRPKELVTRANVIKTEQARMYSDHLPVVIDLEYLDRCQSSSMHHDSA